jgi:hypothetical protein
MNELLCKDLRGKSLPRNRSKAGFARRQVTVSSVKYCNDDCIFSRTGTHSDIFSL